MKAFSFKKKSENLAVVVHIFQTTRNLVISRCCFAEDGKKYTKNYNACVNKLIPRQNALRMSTNLSFRHREHAILLSMERVNKGTKGINS